MNTQDRKLIRGLSLTRPWPYAILRLGKRIENRSWWPPLYIIGNYIALHAAKSWDDDDAAWIESATGQKLPPKPDHQHSVIVGVAKISGYVTHGSGEIPPGQHQWFFGPYGWLLDDVVEFKQPIHCAGALSLWQIPEPVLVQVRQQFSLQV